MYNPRSLFNADNYNLFGSYNDYDLTRSYINSPKLYYPNDIINEVLNVIEENFTEEEMVAWLVLYKHCSMFSNDLSAMVSFVESNISDNNELIEWLREIVRDVPNET